MGHENFSIVGKGSNEEEKNTYNAHSKTFKKNIKNCQSKKLR